MLFNQYKNACISCNIVFSNIRFFLICSIDLCSDVGFWSDTLLIFTHCEALARKAKRRLVYENYVLKYQNFLSHKIVTATKPILNAMNNWENKISSFTGNNEGPDDFSECLTILERCNSHLRCYFSPSFVCYFRESSFMNPFPSTKHLFHLWKCKLIIRIIRKEMKPTSQIIFRRKKLCWRAKTTLVKRPKSNKKVI